jgi:hypothetical protein
MDNVGNLVPAPTMIMVNQTTHYEFDEVEITSGCYTDESTIFHIQMVDTGHFPFYCSVDTLHMHLCWENYFTSTYVENNFRPLAYRILKYMKGTNNTYFQVDHLYCHMDNVGNLVPVPTMIMVNETVTNISFCYIFNGFHILNIGCLI